jgi:hypothetical protein
MIRDLLIRKGRLNKDETCGKYEICFQRLLRRPRPMLLARLDRATA